MLSVAWYMLYELCIMYVLCCLLSVVDCTVYAACGMLNGVCSLLSIEYCLMCCLMCVVNLSVLCCLAYVAYGPLCVVCCMLAVV